MTDKNDSFFPDDLAKGSVTPGFDLNFLDNAGSLTSGSSSKMVAELTELYEEQVKNKSDTPYQMTTMKPKWLGGKELVVMFLQIQGKLSILPIIFDAAVVEEKLDRNKGSMIRGPHYEITYVRPMKSTTKLSENESRSPFLTACVEELLNKKLIDPQTSYASSHLVLAGCITLKSNTSAKVTSILQSAIVDLRTSMWTLHGTDTFSANERDINYLNHRNVVNTVDLNHAAVSVNTFGEQRFSPIKITLSREVASALLSRENLTSVKFAEIGGYIDFRPLSTEELQTWMANNVNTGRLPPLVVPQFVGTITENLEQPGCITPTFQLEIIAGLGKFKDEKLAELVSQCAQYSTVVDQDCKTYNFHYLTPLLNVELMSRGVNHNYSGPMDPIKWILGEQGAITPAKEIATWKDILAPLEVLLDVPSSGAGAKSQMSLLSNLNYFHFKATGVRNTITNALGKEGKIPLGTATRIGEKSQGRRDAREFLSTLALAQKFQASGDVHSDNYVNAQGAISGRKILDDKDASADAHYAARYNMINEVVIDDGSFELETEGTRVIITNQYITKLLADLETIGNVYKTSNSGINTIRQISATAGTTNAINFDEEL